MNIRAYWDKVNETIKRLPEEVWLMSIDNQDKGTHAGAVSIVPRDIAGRRLVEATHRIASEAEVQAYKDAEVVRLEKDRLRENRRDPRRVILADQLTNFGLRGPGPQEAKAK
jgi:hypothetical protein